MFITFQISEVDEMNKKTVWNLLVRVNLSPVTLRQIKARYKNRLSCSLNASFIVLPAGVAGLEKID